MSPLLSPLSYRPVEWSPKPDLNRHDFRREILNLLCIPISPFGVERGAGCEERSRLSSLEG